MQTQPHLRIGRAPGILRHIGADRRRMQHRHLKVAPLYGIGLGRVLRRHQIVGDRDDRKENDDQQKQRNELDSPVRTSVATLRRHAQPKADEARRHQSAHEIENEFQARFVF